MSTQKTFARVETVGESLTVVETMQCERSLTIDGVEVPAVAMRDRYLPEPLPDGVDPNDVMTWPEGPEYLTAIYPADMGWGACPANVAVGWRLEADGFVAPPAPPAPSEAALVAYAADRRWRQETAGIVIGGVPVATDDRSKMMILGARVAAQADPNWTTPWHGADGCIYPLDAAAIVAISDAVSAHVQSTFATFADVKADIASGEITTTSEVDAAFA